MRIHLDRSPKTPLTPEQLEQARHYKTVYFAQGLPIVSLLKKRYRFEPRCWPFTRWHQTVMMTAIPSMLHLTDDTLKAHVAAHMPELAANNIKLSLNEIQRAQVSANKNGLFGLQINSLWGLFTLIVLASLVSNNQTSATSRISNTAVQPSSSTVLSPNNTPAVDPDSQSSLGAVGRAKLSPMTASEAVKSAEQQGGIIALRSAKSGSKTLVMFSDPLCKHCRAFEDTVALLPSDIGLQVIPVAYLQGSKPFVSHILCAAPSEQARRWSALMSPAIKADVEQQCATGPSKADQNSILFARAGLNATPTLVIAETGAIYAGELSPGAVIEWLKK